jgi:hypothetical protein
MYPQPAHSRIMTRKVTMNHTRLIFHSASGEEGTVGVEEDGVEDAEDESGGETDADEGFEHQQVCSHIDKEV